MGAQIPLDQQNKVSMDSASEVREPCWREKSLLSDRALGPEIKRFNRPESPGPTHLNIPGKMVTALILTEWFGSPTQMAHSLLALQRGPLGCLKSGS